MKPLEIPINANINTWDEGLIQSGPSFFEKNSLKYKGICSNTTYSEGDGMLSTTGKKMYVDGNTIKAGNQHFSIPNDYYTVQSIGSDEIGTEEVAIGETVAGVTDDYAYVGKYSYPFSITTDDNTTTWVTTVFHSSWFAAAKYNSTSLEVMLFNSVGGRKIKITSDSIKWNDKYPQLLGKDFSASWEEDISTWYFGWDDDDARKRFMLVYNDNGIGFLRGIGCIGPNHFAYTEPTVCVDEYYIRDNPLKNSTINRHNTDRKWTIRGNPFINGSQGFLPNIYELSNFYKVLPNGVISVWNGPVDLNAMSAKTDDNDNKTFLNKICDCNAALGASLDKNEGEQENSGTNKFYWKLHSHQWAPNNWMKGTDNIKRLTVNKENDGSEDGEQTILGPQTEGEKYLYSPKGWDFEGYSVEGYENTIKWKWGYNLKTQGCLEFVANSYIGGDVQDMFSSMNSWRNITIFGDWTYIYDSMKSSTETSDSDCIFPAMRLFFNNASARGKYWDYSNCHSRFFVYPLYWTAFNKEIVVARGPITDSRYSHGLDMNKIGLSYTLENFNKGLIIKGENCFDPLGNAYNRFTHSGQSEPETPWKLTFDRMDMYENKGDVGGIDSTGGQKVWVPFDCWTYDVSKDYQYGGGDMFLKKLKILGKGEGIQEECFNFGGIGDASLFDTINKSYQAGKYDGTYLREITYSNISVGLSFKNTLIFNATDMKNKFHMYEDADGLHVTLYVGKKAQYATIKHGGEVKIDKLADYMFRVNLLGTKNLLQETRNGLFEFIQSFKSFLQENVWNVATLDLKLPIDEAVSNNLIYYATGINSDLNDEAVSPSFLVPALTINSYINPSDMDYFNKTVLDNRNSPIKQLLRTNDYKIDDGVDLYYTSTSQTTDVTYKETDKLPAVLSENLESYTGVQSNNTSKSDTSYWIDGGTVIYPVAIGSEMSGVNYQTSTIDLPDNYAVRFYNSNNHTWNVYNQNASVWYGKNIFTIMGSNYYFDGQGVYFLGSETSGASKQYSENTLVAYAIGMKYLCNAPSEAYFYSPFDKNLYIFTPSNTLQKSTSLERLGEVLDSCYCPVNQALYLLFDGVLIVKTQDDMAKFEVEGNRLYTTAEGVQVVSDVSYVIHHPDKYEDCLPLKVETDYIGVNGGLLHFSKAHVILYSDEPIDTTVITDYITIQETEVKHFQQKLPIKKSDWHNNRVRITIEPGQTIGNAFKLKIECNDKVGVYSMIGYMDQTMGINTPRK